MIRVLLAALLLAAGIIAVQAMRMHRAELTIAHLQTSAEQARAEAQTAARKAEHTIAIAHARAAEEYERGKEHAKVEADRVVADLNAGAIRLRNHWASCETQRLSDIAATAAEPDAAEQHRRESASRIVRAAAECDAQVAGLQAVVLADREAQ